MDDVVVIYKRCKICCVEKKVKTGFYSTQTSYCIACMKLRSKGQKQIEVKTKWREANKEDIAKYYKDWYKTNGRNRRNKAGFLTKQGEQEDGIVW